MNEQTHGQEVPTRVECPAAKDPAVRLFILAAVLIAGGLWCFLDGYVRGLPKKRETINEQATYYLNHVGGIVFPLAGLVPLAWGVVFLRRKLVADEEGIGFLGKAKVPWSAVRSLDTSRLAGKGILTLRHDHGGQDGRLVLDGWKLQNFRELVALVEKMAAPGEAQPGAPG